MNWSAPVERKLGRQVTSPGPVRVNRVGQTKDQGRRWRVTVFDPVQGRTDRRQDVGRGEKLLMLLPPPDISAAYVDDAKRPSKDFYNWIRSLYEFTRGIRHPHRYGCWSAPLPLATKGVRYLVSDANATTFWSIVGSRWRLHRSGDV